MAWQTGIHCFPRANAEAFRMSFAHSLPMRIDRERMQLPAGQLIGNTDDNLKRLSPIEKNMGKVRGIDSDGIQEGNE
jgi:hypothetical protein